MLRNTRSRLMSIIYQLRLSLHSEFYRQTNLKRYVYSALFVK